MVSGVGGIAHEGAAQTRGMHVRTSLPSGMPGRMHACMHAACAGLACLPCCPIWSLVNPPFHPPDPEIMQEWGWAREAPVSQKTAGGATGAKAARKKVGREGEQRGWDARCRGLRSEAQPQPCRHCLCSDSVHASSM